MPIMLELPTIKTDFLTDFGSFQKSFARLVWGVIEPPSVVFSVCHNLYQKLVFCWHVYDRCTIYRFINWYPNVTI